MMATNQFQDLQAVGFEPGEAGTVILSGPAARLRRAWEVCLARAVASLHPTPFEAPLFIKRETLEKAGYVEHFPQHLFVARSINTLAPRRFITPAACLHLYPRIKSGDLAEPFAGFITACCARHEGGVYEYPFRTAEFHMAEFVAVGQEAEVHRMHDEAQSLLLRLMAAVGLPGELRVATDAFFLGSGDGAQIMQKFKELKKEYVVEVLGRPVALASLNRHEDYFARRFEMGDTTVSFCLAFGLERLTACGLLLWGADERNWPKELC